MTHLLDPLGLEFLELPDVAAVEGVEQVDQPLLVPSLQHVQQRVGQLTTTTTRLTTTTTDHNNIADHNNTTNNNTTADHNTADHNKND